MPGARPRGSRPGDNAEILAEFILRALAFTSSVPRTEDVGHDFLCSLVEQDDNLLKAGPFFTVQIKGRHQDVVYEGDHEVTWITTQENPFFIGVVDREKLALELYSTWNMLNGFLLKGAQKILLRPGEASDDYQPVVTAEDGSEQVVPLGRPVLRMDAHDATDPERARTLASVLRHWVLLERVSNVSRNGTVDRVAARESLTLR